MKALLVLLFACSVLCADPFSQIYKDVQTRTESSGKDYAVHTAAGFLCGVAIYEMLPEDMPPAVRYAVAVAGTAVIAAAKESTDKHYSTEDVREWSVGASVSIVWAGLR